MQTRKANLQRRRSSASRYTAKENIGGEVRIGQMGFGKHTQHAQETARTVVAEQVERRAVRGINTRVLSGGANGDVDLQLMVLQIDGGRGETCQWQDFGGTSGKHTHAYAKLTWSATRGTALPTLRLNQKSRGTATTEGVISDGCNWGMGDKQRYRMAKDLP